MNRMIFVNLPVKDLERATAFYKGLGFEQNMQFSDENASSFVISDTIVAMLLKEEFFKTFIRKPVGDPAQATSAILGISADSREEVDSLYEKAISSGGKEAGDVQDMDGFMYSRPFSDPDGNHWEVIWMDPAAVQEQ